MVRDGDASRKGQINIATKDKTAIPRTKYITLFFNRRWMRWDVRGGKRKSLRRVVLLLCWCIFLFKSRLQRRRARACWTSTSRRGRLAARQEQHSAASVQTNKDLENPHLSTKRICQLLFCWWFLLFHAVTSTSNTAYHHIRVHVRHHLVHRGTLFRRHVRHHGCSSLWIHGV